jgi:hypothetical protein
MISTLSTQLRSKINKNLFSLTLKNLFQINSYSKYNNKSLLFREHKANFSSVYVNHRDTIDNNQDSPFDFTEENYIKVQEIMVIII